MKASILSGLMCQILHTRNSGASVSDEVKRVQHPPTLDDLLIATTETLHYVSVIATEGCRWWHRIQLYSRTTSIARNTYKIVIIS